MGKLRPNVLTIAGFDPSSGAGLSSDIKTFEQFKVLGYAVCTAITYQNSTQFEDLKWESIDSIQHQLEMIFKETKIDWIKFGLIENWEVLKVVILFIKRINPSAKIIFDPILKASAGFDFHGEKQDLLKELLPLLYMITPNYEEAKAIFGEDDLHDKLMNTSNQTLIYLKGGHRLDNVGKDILYHNGKEYAFNPKHKRVKPKHGSGCVLSASLTAGLALGFPLIKSCLKAKSYTAKFLASNTTALGYHK